MDIGKAEVKQKGGNTAVFSFGPIGQELKGVENRICFLKFKKNEWDRPR